jgi:hypothetical protein
MEKPALTGKVFLFQVLLNLSKETDPSKGPLITIGR